ncbi:MAG TPA: 60S ribosomal protein L26, partial [Methanolinea sp.]|nr:60S ribosomal protein L26 [Methanolinea sp.]
DEVDTRKSRIVVQGVSIPKSDGTEMPRPVSPSNVQITKLNLKDPRRAASLGESE